MISVTDAADVPSERGHIEARGVVKRFYSASGAREPVVAVDGIDLTIRPGEFVAVVGPTGCGKSTLMEMIAGLQLPTEGTITIDGAIVEQPDRSRALVFQNYGLFPWQSAIENVAFPLKAAGVAKNERLDRASELLERVRLSPFAAAFPHQLSGGMRQRVAIARALVGEPTILLMDEPFGALDALTRQVMQEELKTVLESVHSTVVFITHSLEEAVYLADRVVVMSRHPGRVKREVEIGERPAGVGHFDLLADPHFAAIFEDLWDILAEELRGASPADRA